MLRGNMREHLYQIFNKIDNNEKFGLIRPSDGEYLILNNHSFTNCDNWTHNSNSLLRKQLIEAVKINMDNLYIGIPCNSCNHSPNGIYDDYINLFNVNTSRLTYANIFCNSNWNLTINYLKNYKKGFYLITCGENDNDFPIKEKLIIDKYLVNKWDTVCDFETKRIIDFIKNKNNELICFASGPITKIWIPECMKINNNNIYLDIGSVLDLYTKGNINPRPYTDSNSVYSKEICNFI